MNFSFPHLKPEKGIFSFSLGSPQGRTHPGPHSGAQLGAHSLARSRVGFPPGALFQEVSGSSPSHGRKGRVSSWSAGLSLQGPNKVVGLLTSKTKGALGTLLSDSLPYRCAN